MPARPPDLGRQKSTRRARIGTLGADREARLAIFFRYGFGSKVSRRSEGIGPRVAFIYRRAIFSRIVCKGDDRARKEVGKRVARTFDEQGVKNVSSGTLDQAPSPRLDRGRSEREVVRGLLHHVQGREERRRSRRKGARVREGWRSAPVRDARLARWSRRNDPRRRIRRGIVEDNRPRLGDAQGRTPIVLHRVGRPVARRGNEVRPLFAVFWRNVGIAMQANG